MYSSDHITVVYEPTSLKRLAKLRPDQQAHIQSLIAYMRGSAFGTAVLEPPFSEKIAFYPGLDYPELAEVTIGWLRIQIVRTLGELLVIAKKR